MLIFTSTLKTKTLLYYFQYGGSLKCLMSNISKTLQKLTKDKLFLFFNYELHCVFIFSVDQKITELLTKN